MPGAGRAEVYFIVAMMILIMVVSVVAVVFFFKTYKKEMKEKELRIQAKLAAAEEKKDAAP
jgi:F0F1-type ATP synthase membrane subunit b/b'